MDYRKDIEKEIFNTEEKIIEWAKLLATCKPDSTRFETRVQSIEHYIRIRQGLRYLHSESI